MSADAHFASSLGTRQRLIAGILGIGVGFGGPFLLSVVLVATSGDPTFLILPLPFLGALWMAQGLAPSGVRLEADGVRLERRWLSRLVPYTAIQECDRTPAPNRWRRRRRPERAVRLVRLALESLDRPALPRHHEHERPGLPPHKRRPTGNLTNQPRRVHRSAARPPSDVGRVMGPTMDREHRGVGVTAVRAPASPAQPGSPGEARRGPSRPPPTSTTAGAPDPRGSACGSGSRPRR